MLRPRQVPNSFTSFDGQSHFVQFPGPSKLNCLRCQTFTGKRSNIDTLQILTIESTAFDVSKWKLDMYSVYMTKIKSSALSLAARLQPTAADAALLSIHRITQH